MGWEGEAPKTIGTWEGEAPPSESFITKATRAVMPYVRPALEMTGATAGALGGAAVGTIGGPTAPLTIPAATIAGGGLGYATGKNIADVIEERAGIKKPRTLAEQITEPIEDFSWGSLMQMGGIAGVNALKAAFKWAKSLGESGLTISKQDIIEKAANIYRTATGTAPAYKTNAATATRLTQEIPGFKPTAGEQTNDPGLIRLQRTLARQSGEAADVEMQHRSENVKVVREYVDKLFPGSQTIDDVIAQVNQTKAATEGAVRRAGESVTGFKAKLTPIESQEAGRGAISKIETVRAPEKAKVEAAYRNLPNEQFPPSNTQKTIQDLKKDFLPGDEEVFPNRAISRANKALNSVDEKGNIIPKEVVGFQDLHSLRKDIGRQVGDAMSGPKPNRELAMKLTKIKDAIDADIEVGMGTNNDYVAARKAYAEYAQKFRTGTVEQVLRKGQQITGRNIPEAQVAKRFFTPDGADDLIRAIGKDNAAIVMEGHAAQDLLNKVVNPTTKEIVPTALNSWVSKNKVVLDKFGIADNFSNLQKAQATLDAAKVAEEGFNKSIAAKLLNADPEKAIETAMQGAEGIGAKNTRELMQRLIIQVKSDPNAIAGLKNAFKDFIISKAENTAKTITGENIISNAKIQTDLKKYDPALKFLYGEKSKEYQALQNVQKAIEVSSRYISYPLGGVPDTAETLNMGTKLLSALVEHKGGVTGIAARVGNRILNSINNMNQEQVNRVLIKAIYDPEFASDLNLIRKGLSPVIAEKKFGSYLLSMGIVGISELK